MVKASQKVTLVRSQEIKSFRANSNIRTSRLTKEAEVVHGNID
jgi:hypothetical protein